MAGQLDFARQTPEFNPHDEPLEVHILRYLPYMKAKSGEREDCFLRACECEQRWQDRRRDLDHIYVREQQLDPLGSFTAGKMYLITPEQKFAIPLIGLLRAKKSKPREIPPIRCITIRRRPITLSPTHRSCSRRTCHPRHGIIPNPREYWHTLLFSSRTRAFF